MSILVPEIKLTNLARDFIALRNIRIVYWARIHGFHSIHNVARNLLWNWALALIMVSTCWNIPKESTFESTFVQKIHPSDTQLFSLKVAVIMQIFLFLHSRYRQMVFWVLNIFFIFRTKTSFESLWITYAIFQNISTCRHRDQSSLAHVC